MGMACSTHEREINLYKVLEGKPEGKRPVGRTRQKREGYIKMDLKETGLEWYDWVDMAQDRDQWRGFVKTAMNLSS
jgi:hypothetical protein